MIKKNILNIKRERFVKRRRLPEDTTPSRTDDEQLEVIESRRFRAWRWTLTSGGWTRRRWTRLDIADGARDVHVHSCPMYPVGRQLATRRLVAPAVRVARGFHPCFAFLGDFALVPPPSSLRRGALGVNRGPFSIAPSLSGRFLTESIVLAGCQHNFNRSSV